MWFHGMLAKLAPEWSISHDEAAELASKLAAYAKHTSYQVSEKTSDLIALLMVLAVVELTRLQRVTSRLKIERKAAQVDAAARAQAAGNVVDIGGIRGT